MATKSKTGSTLAVNTGTSGFNATGNTMAVKTGSSGFRATGTTLNVKTGRSTFNADGDVTTAATTTTPLVAIVTTPVTYPDGFALDAAGNLSDAEDQAVAINVTAYDPTTQTITYADGTTGACPTTSLAPAVATANSTAMPDQTDTPCGCKAKKAKGMCFLAGLLTGVIITYLVVRREA